MSMNRVRVGAAAALASGAVWLAISTPAYPSVFVASASPPASIDLPTQATLLAKGARVAVPVTYNCPGDTQFASIFVRVTQRFGSSITSADWNSEVTCNGEDTYLEVQMDAASRPFKKGIAAGTARLYLYKQGPWGWDIELVDSDVLRIK